MNLAVRGKRKPKAPCLGCFLSPQFCICDLIPLLHLKTKVSLIVHHRELKRTTNTGRLVVKALSNSEMRIRGQGRAALNLSDLLSADYQSYLFYPCDSAQQLSAELLSQVKKPIQLIVPDGNWRQASKVHYRHPELKDVPRIMIGTPSMHGDLSQFHLRAEHTDFGMATLQAVAEALTIIEGPEIGGRLMDLYHAKLRKTLLGRGQLV